MDVSVVRLETDLIITFFPSEIRSLRLSRRQCRKDGLLCNGTVEGIVVFVIICTIDGYFLPLQWAFRCPYRRRLHTGSCRDRTGRGEIIRRLTLRIRGNGEIPALLYLRLVAFFIFTTLTTLFALIFFVLEARREYCRIA